jgi:hypothetical protein
MQLFAPSGFLIAGGKKASSRPNRRVVADSKPQREHIHGHLARDAEGAPPYMVPQFPTVRTKTGGGLLFPIESPRQIPRAHWLGGIKKRPEKSTCPKTKDIAGIVKIKLSELRI